jgi:hypothetical protein
MIRIPTLSFIYYWIRQFEIRYDASSTVPKINHRKENKVLIFPFIILRRRHGTITGNKIGKLTRYPKLTTEEKRTKILVLSFLFFSGRYLRIGIGTVPVPVPKITTEEKRTKIWFCLFFTFRNSISASVLARYHKPVAGYMITQILLVRTIPKQCRGKEGNKNRSSFNFILFPTFLVQGQQCYTRVNIKRCLVSN